MTDHHDPASDDELIARLSRAAGPTPVHDPYLDLPIAREERVPGDQSCPAAGQRCNAPGRRPLAVQGYFDVPVTEPVACELKAGHPGQHLAGFSRTRVLRHWRAFGWPEQVPGAKAP